MKKMTKKAQEAIKAFVIGSNPKRTLPIKVKVNKYGAVIVTGKRKDC